MNVCLQLDIHVRILSAVAAVSFWHAAWSTLRLIAPTFTCVDIGMRDGLECIVKTPEFSESEMRSKADRKNPQNLSCQGQAAQVAVGYARVVWLGLRFMGDVASQPAVSMVVLSSTI